MHRQCDLRRVSICIDRMPAEHTHVMITESSYASHIAQEIEQKAMQSRSVILLASDELENG